MTDHATNKRIQRQREPKRAAFLADRHKAARVCNEVVVRNGITEATQDAVRAIGGGSSDDWPQDMPAKPLEGAQDARNDFGQARTAQKVRKAAVARKNGDSA